MAVAQMALAIEMDNRMKRKARAMGVFLNVETQRKFLKMVSNVKLQREKECLKVKADNLQNTVNVHLKYWAESDKHKDTQIEELKEVCVAAESNQKCLHEHLHFFVTENQGLKDENEKLKRRRKNGSSGRFCKYGWTRKYI